MRKSIWAAIFVAGISTASFGAGYDNLNVAISYFNQEDYDNAILWFSKAIDAGDLIPDHKRVAYLDRATAQKAKGNAKAAFADLAAAIAAQPDNVLGYRTRIAFSIAAGDMAQVEQDYATLHKLRPHDRDASLNLGWIDWEAGRYDAAARGFEYFSSKRDTEAWLWLQLANARLGKPLTPYEETIETRQWPGPVVSYFRGRISESALVDASESARSHSAICDAPMFIGMWRAAHKDGQGAVPFLNKAVEKCRRDSPYGRMPGRELQRIAEGKK